MNDSLPVLGAALTVPYLEQYREWMLKKPRDLELQDFFSPRVLDGDWAPIVEQARKLTDGFQGRIGIHGPFIGFSFKAYDTEIQDVIRKRMDQGLEICRALGGTHMVIHSPFTYWDHYNIPNRDGTMDRILECCHANLRDAVRKAEDIGCVMVLENIEDINPDDRLELVNSFNSNALQVSIDTGHAHFAHCSFNAPPVDYFVKSAGDKLGHVHIQDVDGYADRHWVPGEGSIPWHAVFRALSAVSSNPRLIIELADQTKVLDAAAWLEAQGLAQS